MDSKPKKRKRRLPSPIPEIGVTLAGLLASGDTIDTPAEAGQNNLSVIVADDGEQKDVPAVIEELKIHLKKPAVAPEKIDQLIKDLGSPVYATRAKATKELKEEIGPQAQAKLQLAAKSPDREIATRAADVLKIFVPVDENERIEKVKGLLKQLANHEAEAKDAVPLLNQAIVAEKDETVLWQAMVALKYVGPAAESAVPKLEELLDHPEKSLRWSAAAVLGKIGGKAKAAVPKLIRVLEKDTSPHAREAAANALGMIGERKAIPALEKAREKDSDVDVREAATKALERIGPDIKEVAPEARGKDEGEDKWAQEIGQGALAAEASEEKPCGRNR